MREKIVNFRLNTVNKPMALNLNSLEVGKQTKFTKWLINKLIKWEILVYKLEYKREVETEIIELDLDKLERFLIDEIYHFEYLGYVVERIVMGRSQYDKLIQGSLNRCLDVPPQYFRGIKVQLNPFIDGVVFITKDRW